MPKNQKKNWVLQHSILSPWLAATLAGFIRLSTKHFQYARASALFGALASPSIVFARR